MGVGSLWVTHVGLALNVRSYHFGFCVRDSSTPEAQCGVLRHGCDRDNLYGFETIPLLRTYLGFYEWRIE